jgi:hypothetical protein
MTTLRGVLEDSLAEFLTWLRAAWHADALCREHPDVNFFPERGEDVRPALAICGPCLAQTECEAAGIEGGEHGIWGATTGRDRRRMREGLRTAA